MLLNPFLQLGKLRQRPLRWSLLFPVTQQLSLFLLIGSLTRCPSPQARPVTGPGGDPGVCSDICSLTLELPTDGRH